MTQIQKVELKQIDQKNDQFEIVLHLEPPLYEFSSEFGTSEKKDLMTQAKKIIRRHYPNLKITMVKVIVGGIAVASLPLMNLNSHTVEASLAAQTNQQLQTESIYYRVQAGDTLWKLAEKYHSTIDLIRQANQLKSDTIQVNQPLIIPQSIHTVKTGDYLSVLAKQYGVTIDSIKEANNLASDIVRLDEKLIIPTLVNDSDVSQPITSEQQEKTYTVVSEDSLYLIAQRFD